MSELVTLALKLPRNSQVTPEAARTFLSALTQVNYISTWQKLFGAKRKPFALEIALINQQIYFLITCHPTLISFIETQIKSNYPLVIIEKIKDPLAEIAYNVVNLSLQKGNFYPIATFENFQEVDPLASILSVLAKSDPNELTIIQFALEATNTSWQTKGASFAQKGTKNPDGTYSVRSDANIINEKISYPGFKCSIRLISNTNKTLTELSSAFGVFNKSDGNYFTSHRPSVFNKKREIKAALTRLVTEFNILNVNELATLWHLPSEKIKVPSIIWGTKWWAGGMQHPFLMAFAFSDKASGVQAKA